MGSSHIKAKTQSYPKQTRSTLFELNQSKLSLTQTTPHFTSPQPCPATTPTTPKVTRTRTNTQATTNPPQAPTQATASQDLNPTKPSGWEEGRGVLRDRMSRRFWKGWRGCPRMLDGCWWALRIAIGREKSCFQRCRWR